MAFEPLVAAISFTVHRSNIDALPASGIEARRAETEGLGSREPVPAGDALSLPLPIPRTLNPLQGEN